jgi:peptidoglycan/xylan/chitin deacetylase (PgdA/CDA1 family)
MAFWKQTEKPGETQIALWKDDKQAVFCLMFDDSVTSDVKNVVPELKKRNLVGTFYINPGSGQWKQFATAWETEFPKVPQVVYGNHTMTHKGATSVAQLGEELEKCNDVIYKLVPGKKPRLISFGRPGVKKEDWTVTDAQVVEQLKKYQLIERPPFGDHGAMIGMKTPEEMIQRVDGALQKRSLEYIVFHGVGGDWIVTPTEIFVRFLDLLEPRRDRLWITDHISAYSYQTEREQTEVRTLSADARQIRLNLTVKTDPVLYNQPLTLITRVPADWKQCEVLTAGKTPPVRVAPKAGLVQYAVAPQSGAITIRKARAEVGPSPRLRGGAANFCSGLLQVGPKSRFNPSPRPNAAKKVS